MGQPKKRRASIGCVLAESRDSLLGMLSLSAVRSLEALRAFEAVARTGSFSQAAKELGITHGAVSRKIGTLEYDLGFLLFARSSRGVTRTAMGQVLFETTHKALSELSRTIDRLKSNIEHRPFLVSCERSIAMKWLIPRLPIFQNENPEVLVYLSTGGGRSNSFHHRWTLQSVAPISSWNLAGTSSRS